jgi:hypothetical protein
VDHRNPHPRALGPRRSTSSLVKYSLQCRERDFFQFDDTDTASQAGSDDDDDGTSVKTRESAAR